MSHVATVDLEIRDLDALADACRQIGLELVRGQTSYHWFGQHVGDYPLPAGLTEDELGKCDHAIRVAGFTGDRTDDEAPYEVGVVRRRDGRPGYQLMWDFFAGGHGLQKHCGTDCSNIRREYAVSVAKKQAMAQGFTLTQQKQADGSIRLVMRR